MRCELRRPNNVFDPGANGHSGPIAVFIALVEAIDRMHDPAPGVETKPLVIVLDNGSIHVSKATTRALEPRAHWLTVERQITGPNATRSSGPGAT